MRPLLKALIPALSHVAANELLDPIRRYQARIIETTAQRQALVNELAGTHDKGHAGDPPL
ncbi:MAG: hypothetical protein KA524_11900 [Nitrosomonas sp.]|nr:hypothetical protein [Nitrosomonas sp.]MBP6077108.1 hypothetical protein [Nitrosomonas sp.]